MRNKKKKMKQNIQSQTQTSMKTIRAKEPTYRLELFFLTILSIVLLIRALFLIEIQNNDDDMAHTHINDNFKIHP